MSTVRGVLRYDACVSEPQLPTASIAPGARVRLHHAYHCCPLAGAVSARVADYLEANGLTLVEGEADAHVINTCGSDAGKAQLAFDALVRIEAEGDAHKPVIALGCLVSIEPRRMRAAMAPFARHALLDPRRTAELDQLVSPRALPFSEVPESLRVDPRAGKDASAWARVTVSTGCLGRCSFCAIRRATGRPRSRSIEEILADVDRVVAAGTPDVLLVSTDVSAWGTDRGQSVVELLRAIAAHPSEALFSIESLEPTLFLAHLEALLPILASRRFAMIALPIQSGSQRVLDRMRRTYAIDAVLDAVERVRAVDAGIVVRTDLIYGFGDETREELEASFRAAERFDRVGINAYQPRPGTPPLELSAEELAERGARAMEVHRALTARPRRALRRVVPLPDPELEPAREPIDDGVGSELVALRIGRHGPAGEVNNVDNDVDFGGSGAGSGLGSGSGSGSGWMRAAGARIAGALRRGALGDGEGYRVRDVRTDDALDAVVLELELEGGARVDVALAHPAREGAHAVRSSRYVAFVLGDAPGDERARRALTRFLSTLTEQGAPA